jgi:rare lipoprotein A
MLTFRRSALLLTTILAGVALSGCAETTFAVNATKSLTQSDGKQQGVYKIGDPYQINGSWYYPAEDYNYDETGIASYYGGEQKGVDFHGRLTANGEVYDMNALTAAHQTLPLPSLVRVTNLENGRSIVVRVNDRGPYARGRILDMSRRAAQLLGYEGKGTAKVRVQIMADDSRQLKYAMLQGRGTPGTEVAAAPRTAVQSDVLAAPTGSRSAGSVASAALPPPSETLSQTGATSQRQRNGRVTSEPLARPAAPVTPPPGQGSIDNFPPPVAAGRAAPVLPREVAALPVPEQAKARATVTQQPVHASTMFVQAGAFANYDNAYRLSAKLSRYGKTQITPVTTGGQKLYRVRVGPVASVQEADNILEWVTNDAPQARIVVAD